jgi:hypothetical protein
VAYAARVSMPMRNLPWIALRTAAGACALFVTIRGFRGAYGIEFRADTLISALYVAFPCCSFLVFLFARRARVELLLQSLIAAGYLSTFAFLNWRTCSSLGYCSTVAATVLTTLEARPVLAAFALVVLSGAAMACDARPALRRASVSVPSTASRVRQDS